MPNSLPPGVVGPFAGMDVPWLLRMRAEMRRDHPFLIWAPFDAPARIWSYGEFHARVGALAAGLVVRGISLAASMSNYLIHRIRETTNITLHTSTELIALEGDPRLSSVTWRTGPDGLVERYEIGHVFLMTGAVPNTAWLAGCVELDEQQFIRTGGIRQIPDPVSGTSREQACGMFETSIPGVFAIGDVRSGSVKRVAAAVGEGAACIQLVHSALAATSTTGR